MIRSHCRWFAGFFANPLPDLPTVLLVGEDDQVFEVVLGDELIHFDPNCIHRNRVGHEHDHAALLGNGLKTVVMTVDLLQQFGGKVVPSKLFDE